MGLRVNAARALRGGEQLRRCRRLVRTPLLSPVPAARVVHSHLSKGQRATSA